MAHKQDAAAGQVEQKSVTIHATAVKLPAGGVLLKALRSWQVEPCLSFDRASRRAPCRR